MNVLSIVYLVLSLLLIGRIVYQLIKKKRLPRSNYTPFDDMMMGMDPDLKENNQILGDTKHETNYEERTTRKG
ncbi:hypothetical protein PB01_09530 [Psychrobacillus glaciei]|uniref:DUF3951 domain-containing protein n=1 Tax=Psychrobacillus glaciei TaxID=2283160 RepID=A0A5J6SS80_9BACI|nr:hypothetical protein [Psychrobacillus glaciei]QFF99047.1 hypothetical protein PB01_09530 [Psychrobacillus glaciei]